MIESTLNEIYSVVSEYNKRNKNNYNIFKVLEMTDREVLMCRVLADFLNPAGAHGKGSRYLKIFLEKIIGRKDYIAICASAHVFKEYPITQDRRIDIVIQAEDTFIPIEVKIHAEEQKAQCYDYYNYAVKKDSQTKVIYLTKWGTMPSDYSLYSEDGKNVLPKEKVHCISFAKNICNFMELIIESEEDFVMKEVAKQYCDAVKAFTVFADKELQMEVVDKLCESEQNFRSMIVIEQAAKKTKAKLMYYLLEEFEAYFLPLQEKYSLERETRFLWYDYKVQATEEYYAQSESTYPGLNYIFSNILLPDGIQLWFRIEIDYNLFAGICLFDANSKNQTGSGNQLDCPSSVIKTELNKYIELKEAQYANWWVTYWYLPTAYSSAKIEGNKIPNFKEMNEAAIILADKKIRQNFVKECIQIIEKKLDKIIIHTNLKQGDADKSLCHTNVL